MASSLAGGYAHRHTLRAEESKQQLSPALPVFINPRGAYAPWVRGPEIFRRPHESNDVQPSNAADDLTASGCAGLEELPLSTAFRLCHDRCIE